MRGKVAVVVAVLAAVVLAVPAFAGLQIGAKAWVQETELDVQGFDVTSEGTGVSLGPTASLDLSDSLWVSASWLIGYTDWDEGAAEELTQDAEAVLAISFDWLDLGIGIRYTEDTFDVGGGIEETFRKYGPMAYVGLGSSFGDSPLGWYAAGSWMFADLADDWEDFTGDAGGEHYNVEGGLSLFLAPLTATVGYRYKNYYDSDVIDMTYQGVTVSAGLAF